MKLDVAVNEVTLSNVGPTGEFRIRNSAKAFSILSSGLYSNKIRAIIRELSCNAVDSHVGAGKADVPFIVHLPTILEPWFSVQDFGMGLDGDQIENIYTTYFESTKTDSNAFIGALGLGSKSPFSYTENFTVTAIKNGVQRIYSAFINEQGVPSIAQMNEVLTDIGNGVEVKFSVTDRSDYHSFRQEAYQVFQWFKVQPTITGNLVTVDPVKYIEKDIIPGIHSWSYHRSVALMGNISYPLDSIPQVEKHFGELAHLLECALVLEFDIGELDFAASREQLSFIPLTLESIKRKLETLNANLAKHLASKADLIDHPWHRAVFLQKQCQTSLYKSAVKKYVTDTKFELFDTNHYSGQKYFDLTVPELKDANVTVHAIHTRNGSSSKIGLSSKHNGTDYTYSYAVPVQDDVVIVLNDLKTGCLARARYHFNRCHGKPAMVYCLSHASEDLAVRQVEYDKILKKLHNPPNIVKASDLEKEVRNKRTSTQGITYLRLKAQCRHGYADSYTWEPSKAEIDDEETYYYVELKNHESLDEDGNVFDFRQVKAWMVQSGITEIADLIVYGVRQSRIKELSAMDNWVRIEEKLREETAKVTDADIINLVMSEMVDSYQNRVYTNAVVAKLAGPDSNYTKYYEKYGKAVRKTGQTSQLATLCGKYGKAFEVDKIRKSIEEARAAVMKQYPLLAYVSQAKDRQIADYIKLVDKQENT